MGLAAVRASSGDVYAVDSLLKFQMGLASVGFFSVFFFSLLVVGGSPLPPIFLSTKQGQKIYIHDVFCFSQNI